MHESYLLMILRLKFSVEMAVSYHQQKQFIYFMSWNAIWASFIAILSINSILLYLTNLTVTYKQNQIIAPDTILNYAKEEQILTALLPSTWNAYLMMIPGFYLLKSIIIYSLKKIMMQ
jgi:hypothetical protein